MNELERSVSRFVDGEMQRDEQVAFEARLRDDAGLRAAVAEARELRGLFAPERAAPAPQPSADFRTRVMAATGRAAGVGPPDVERWARNVVLAAAVLIATVLVLAFGVLHKADTGRLEASPAEMKRTIEALDVKLKSAEGSVEGR